MNIQQLRRDYDADPSDENQTRLLLAMLRLGVPAEPDDPTEFYQMLYDEDPSRMRGLQLVEHLRTVRPRYWRLQEIEAEMMERGWMPYPDMTRARMLRGALAESHSFYFEDESRIRIYLASNDWESSNEHVNVEVQLELLPEGVQTYSVFDNDLITQTFQYGPIIPYLDDPTDPEFLNQVMDQVNRAADMVNYSDCPECGYHTFEFCCEDDDNDEEED